ncbi:hypothetical protein JCM11641_000923 [Rhodosporidiobolus odoratus]
MLHPNGSSAANSPYLPQHSTIPLLRDFERPKEGFDSPSLPSLPADEKIRIRSRPSTRAILPGVAIVLAVTSLFFLANSFTSLTTARDAYLDTLHSAVYSPPTAERINQWFHEQPSRPLRQEDTVVVEGKEDHTVTAIVLHGLGGGAHDYPFVQHLADRYPYVRCTFDDLHKNEDVAGYAHSQQQLNRLADEERQRMVSMGKEPRIVQMGFSQGGVMTLLSLLTAQSASRYEAGVVFSAYLPLPTRIQKLISPAAITTPIFWGHGRADPYLTYLNAQKGIRLLRSLTRVKQLRHLTFRGYDGVQHGWADQELDDMAAWFGQHVPRTRADPAASSNSEAGSSQSPPSEEEFQREVETENAVERVEEIELNADLPSKKSRRRSQVTRRSR